MTKPKVFIYPGDSYHAAIEMFERRGFEIVKDFEVVNLVCFLGGTDVDPKIYNEERHPMTQSPDTDRDALEVSAYEIWKARGVPMVGICRGGQLLNVLNGGRMIQHLGEYISGDVQMTLAYDNRDITVRVDHHQGMLVHDVSGILDSYGDGDVIAWLERDGFGDWPEYIVFYEDTKSLCFQGHPEWGHSGTEDYFFELLETKLNLKGGE